MSINLLISSVLLICVPASESSNILFFHTSCTASHRISIWPLAEKLADSGHHVTYIYPISRRPGFHPKIEELVPSKAVPAVDSVIGNFDINFTLNSTLHLWLFNAMSKVAQFCEDIYDSPEIVEWLARPNLKIDLVIIDIGGFGQCAYGLVHKFKAKHILFSSMPVPYMTDYFGVTPETSSVPGFFPLKPGELSKPFWQRVVDTIGIVPVRFMYWYTMKQFENVARERLKLKDMPSFEEIEQNTSLVLHNSYLFDDYVQSLPPFFVSYSGLHCTEKNIKERKALPEVSNLQKLENFIEDSNGFVYINFGSTVNVTGVPDALRNEFFTAFSQFPKLRFLWRWDGPVPNGVPSNVFLDKWFPQLDLLAHPKIKAFVTQAGQPSTQEALCYAVPMIAIPIFGDQVFNAYRMEYYEIAVSLDITSLKAEDLRNAVEKVAFSNMYKQRITELSQMYRDRPVDPLQNALFWVEYVLTYDTSLLKPLAMYQTWWQRRLLDVYAFIFIAVVFTCALLLLMFYYLFKLLKYCFCKTIGTRAKKEKTN